MKKFFPIIILLLGVLVVVGVFFFLRSRKSESGMGEEKVPEVAFADRPVTSLTPSEDGHWLKLKVEKLKVKAKSLDYELLYNLPDGRTQGVPGTIELGNSQAIERDLLLGSESKGKYTYDEGVQEGTLTLKFRNEKGKLTAKFSTNFSLLSKTMDLASVDGKFTFALDKESDSFFVVMETFGAPDGYPSGSLVGPYGVFSTQVKDVSGVVSLGSGSIHGYFGSNWTKLESGKSQNLGIFVGTSE